MVKIVVKGSGTNIYFRASAVSNKKCSSIYFLLVFNLFFPKDCHPSYPEDFMIIARRAPQIHAQHGLSTNINYNLALTTYGRKLEHF